MERMTGGSWEWVEGGGKVGNGLEGRGGKLGNGVEVVGNGVGGCKILKGVGGMKDYDKQNCIVLLYSCFAGKYED